MLTEPVEIHFDDLDPQGVVHNSRYALFIERVLGAFWRRHGFSFRDGRPTKPDVFHVVAEFGVRYLAPIPGTGTVHVHLWLEHLGGSSARYGFRVSSVDGSVTHAEGHRVNIRVDQSTRRPTPWSDESRAVASLLLPEGAAAGAVLPEKVA
ncbi:acyl-CoA thioesterase [Virgisporangium aliadipatigenens]|uniref:acyl-CoA thioesterase n=1 Tax=Virgisporangium aliadipatigenens TaxID=741659 RepID=UPI001EF39720|nr:thioesterase family protein [Virgisporangium aliadipatigenens]